MPIGIGLATVGSSIAGGVIQSGAAHSAAAAANAAAAKANGILQGVQDQTKLNLQPFVDSGQHYNSALEGLLGVGGDPNASRQAFQNYLGSTNYQFRLDQGLNAVKTANAPAFSSSATAKALTQYAEGTAGDALQGYEGLLQNGVGQGISAGSNLGQLGNQNAGLQSQNLMGAAGVQASADIYGGNALTGALKGVTSGLSSFGGGVGNALSGMLGGGGGGGGGASAFNQPGYMPFAATGSI